MTDLSTGYMKLSLANPLIVSSCGLTNSVEGLRRCADAGAAAVVLKSLFEEQIAEEKRALAEDSILYNHPEAFDYVENMSMALGPREYLNLIEQGKKAVSIPVIASLNCLSPAWWISYARQIESAGADGLELNIAVMPSSPDRKSREIEALHIRIVEEVRQAVRIPIAVKMSPFFTSTAHMAGALCRSGADALVLFNRFYRFDIDVRKMKLVPAYHLSSPSEISSSLRWMSLLAGQVDCDLAASTGIHDGAGAIKMLLAGAKTVQVCSTLYLHGLPRIRTILDEVAQWMKEHQFEDIGQFRGRLSRMESDSPEIYERIQYIKLLVGIE